MAKRGRPSSYTPEIAAEICELLASGSSVRKACELLGISEQAQVFRWLSANEDFRNQYARARESRADARFERADDIMQELRDGKIDANQARVMLDAIKWQTGKEAPKRYGDRLELAGDKNAPIASELTIRFVDGPEKGENKA